jgi:hypothetical protein
MDFLVFNPAIESKIQNPKWGGIFAIGLTFAMWGWWRPTCCPGRIGNSVKKATGNGRGGPVCPPVRRADTQVGPYSIVSVISTIGRNLRSFTSFRMTMRSWAIASQPTLGEGQGEGNEE